MESELLRSFIFTVLDHNTFFLVLVVDMKGALEKIDNSMKSRLVFEYQTINTSPFLLS